MPLSEPTHDPIALRVAARYARQQSLRKDVVKTFRKELLTLAGNAPRIKTLKDGLKLRSGMVMWRERMQEFGGQIRRDLEGRIRETKYRTEYPQPGQGVRSLTNPEWAQYYLDHMKPFWELLYEAGNVTSYIGSGRETQYHGLDDKLDLDGLRKWATRIKSKARATWKFLDELSEWAERSDFYGGGGEPIDLVDLTPESMRLEGFNVQVIGYNEDRADDLASYKQGLALYKRRAKAVYPLLLKHQLPLKLNFVRTLDVGNAEATYNHTYINISSWGLTSKPRRVAQVVAHEMGHHLYKTALNSAAQKDWKDAIGGNYKKLDLRAALPTLKRYARRGMAVSDELGRADPILYLQLQALYENDRGPFRSLVSIDELEDYLASGKDPIIHVLAKPVTAYGGKNPEEAFCEAIGLLVGYGPRTLLPEVKMLLQAITPGRLVLGAVDSKPSPAFSSGTSRF